MKNRLLLLLFLIAAIAACRKEKDATEAVIAEPAVPPEVAKTSKKYTVDTVSSVINWWGSKPTGTHTGTIRLLDGQLFANDSMAETGNFTIDMNSITVTDQKGEKKQQLESHLKGLGKEADADHFFNTKKYPKGSFEITGIAAHEGKSMIEGNLTIKDITKNIKFPVAITVTDSVVTLISERFKINRTLWNITYSSKSAMEGLGDKYIDDDIEILVSLTARRKVNVKRR